MVRTPGSFKEFVTRGKYAGDTSTIEALSWLRLALAVMSKDDRPLPEGLLPRRALPRLYGPLMSTRSPRRLGSEVAARSDAEFGEDVFQVGLDGGAPH